MASNERVYAKPPLVEAVVEFRFSGGEAWSESTFILLNERFSVEYSGQPRVTGQLQLDATVDGKEVTTSAKHTPHAVLFCSADGAKAVGVGDNLLSIHALAPYPGWDRFLARVRAAFELYVGVVKPTGISRVAVRYIDRITLPEKAGALADYFVVMPPKPRSMFPFLSAFHIVLQTFDQDENIAMLTLSSSEPDDTGSTVVLYDLNLVRDFPEQEPLDRWEQHAEALHQRQKDIFEESITDQMRKLFQ